MTIPKRIQRLDPVTVNRIAAGEVIHRPCNAIKELLENSLDAGSTSISITLKDGGLSKILIQDNGSGILKQDLEIVCERFTTSKLTCFSDLERISTFGFRGEALASLSHVSHLSITTKTQDQPCAYKAEYKDGKMMSLKPTAGNDGTLICIEDLFYNVPTRKKALKSNEEYIKVLKVVQAYAVHYPLVQFTCKKLNGQPDLTTLCNTHEQVITTIYGAVGKDLVSVQLDRPRFKVHGCLSNANKANKKLTFLLFINHRLVEHLELKKEIDLLYSKYLPKGSHPFVYLSIEMPSENVDVNVHPTKQRVQFLHEAEIVKEIISGIESSLGRVNESRTFTVPQIKTISATQLIRTHDNHTIDSFIRTRPEGSDYVHVEFSSILELRQQVQLQCCPELKEIFSRVSFIGTVDESCALLQHSTKIYLFNFQLLSRDLMYQLALIRFANFGRIRFPGLNLMDILMKLVDREKAIAYVEILESKADLLSEYFSLDISPLSSLPVLMNDYTPNINRLPQFLVDLAQVDYTTEKACFQGICEAIADFYTINETHCSLLFDSHQYYQPNKSLLPTVTQLANLGDLYKIFERC